MSRSKTTPPAKKSAEAIKQPAKPAIHYPLLLWLVFFGGSLFFIPQCQDRYLVPRFFFLSLVMLGALVWYWRHWQRAAWQLGGFEWLLLVWYGFNAAAVTWAFNWAEGVFYAQKVLLFLCVYALVRQALARDEALTRRTLFLVFNGATIVVTALLIIQIGLSVRAYGLDNEHLYDMASGVSGNKGLATDFVFFLLIFNILFRDQFRQSRWFGLYTGILLLLLLVLQTRTVYLAVAAAALVYFPGRALLEPAFRPVFFRKILPGGLLLLALGGGLLAWKGAGSSLAERLNPATYLESASATERRFVWYKTDELNKEHFWWGVGNGSWKILFPSKSIEGGYRLQEKGIVFTRAHNDYLEIRAEMGIVGISLFLLLFAAALGAAIWAMRDAQSPGTRHDLLVLIAGLLGYCIIQYFDFPRERIELQAILGLFFGYMAHQSRAAWARLPRWSAQPYANAGLGILAAGLLFNLVIGWERITGEIHTVRMLEAKAKANYPLMQREAARAQNECYVYNDVVMPMTWFEGIAYYQMNRIEDALTAFEAAYRLNPWAFQVINNYASTLVRAGRYRDAIPLFEQALYINPRYDKGKFNIAYAWYTLGDTTQAMHWLARVDTIPNPPTDQDRRTNRATLSEKAELERLIRSKPPK